MPYIIKFYKQAEKDKLKLKNSNLEKNCKNILILIQNDPFCYPTSFEKLCGDLTGLYSRRINRQHRIVYEVLEGKKKSISLGCGLIMLVYKATTYLVSCFFIPFLFLLPFSSLILCFLLFTINLAIS